MKKEDIDRLIEESLSKEEAEFYNQLEEPNLFKQWGNLYKTKMSGWSMIATFVQLLFTTLAFWTGFKFFTVESTSEMVFWGTCVIISVLGSAVLKMWHWMQMDKNTILQEMKRIEFQIAVLTEKMSDKK